jgi:Ca-activated chloride channel homolog
VTFLVPMALAALAVVPAIYLIHLFRGSQKRVRVPATFLWSSLPKGLSSRNRRRLPPLRLLLLLQLLGAAALAFALGRPVSLVAANRHLAIVLDASGSMQAGDVGESRFATARARALERVGTLSDGDTATLVHAGIAAAVVESGEPGRVRRALGAAEPGAGSGALREAIAIASHQVATTPEKHGEILVVTDGAFPELESVGALNAPVEFLSVGGGSGNQAIVGLEARPQPTGRSQEALVTLANYEDRAVRVPMRALGDDLLLESREVDLPANGLARVTLTLPTETGRVTVQLAGRDALSLDDIAEVTTPSARPREVRLVSRFPAPLQHALQAISYVRLSVANPDQPSDGATVDLTVLDGVLPAPLPPGPLLIVNPPSGATALRVRGEVRDVQTTYFEPDHPLLLGVDAPSLQIGKAARMDPPTWARVVMGATRAPLVLDGQLEGRPVVVFAFDSLLSGLEKSLAFPLLTSNAVTYLVNGGLGPNVSPGETLTLPTPSGGSGALLVRPDGTLEELAAGGGALRISHTNEVGRYSVLDSSGGQVLRMFSVNLEDAAESDIRPRALDGLAATQTAATSATPQPGTEWWRLLVGAAVLLLSLEWLVFSRRG